MRQIGCPRGRKHVRIIDTWSKVFVRGTYCMRYLSPFRAVAAAWPRELWSAQGEQAHCSQAPARFAARRFALWQGNSAEFSPSHGGSGVHFFGAIETNGAWVKKRLHRQPKG